MAQTYAPTSLIKGTLGTFGLAFQESSRFSLIERISTVVESSASEEKYAWLAEAPQMAEVTSSINFVGLGDASYTLTNKEYAAGLVFKRRDVENDQAGMIGQRIRQLATTAAFHPNKLLIDLLTNGNSSTLGLDYTGEAFFNDTHAVRGKQSATQDNIISGGGTTTAQIAADIGLSIGRMLKFESESGEPFNEMITKVAIVTPTALWQPMHEAVHGALISQTSNVQLAGMQIDLIPTGRLDASDANNFYVLDVSGSLKPLIFQFNTGVEFAEDRTGELAFSANQYRYKAQAFYTAGYSCWQKAVRVVNS